MAENQINITSTNLADLLPDVETIECEELYTKAYRHYQQERISKTALTLSGILRRNPRFGKAYILLGRINEWHYRNYEMAEQYYLAGIAVSPRYRFGYSDYFNFLRNRNRFAEATQYIEQWAALGIEEETVAYEYGLLHEMQGDTQNALKYYQRAAQLAVQNNNYNNRSGDVERCRNKLGTLEPDDE